MRRSIPLAALLVLAAVSARPEATVAQTVGPVAPVPGPYQAIPAPKGNAYSGGPGGQAMPYWMRPPAGQAGRGAAPVVGRAPQRNFIPGWVWSPYPPGAQANRPVGQGMAPAPQYGGGYRPAPPAPGYGTVPWAPPGYAPAPWPAPTYAAPQYNGAYPQPEQ